MIVDEAVGASDWIALSTDGWTDVTMTPIINFMAYTDRSEVHVYSYQDTDENSHMGYYIFEQVIDARPKWGGVWLG